MENKQYHVTYYGYNGKEVVAKMTDSLTNMEIEAVSHNVKQFIIDNHPQGDSLKLSSAFLSVENHPANEVA